MCEGLAEGRIKSVHAIRVIRPSYNSMGASTVTFIDDGSTRCQRHIALAMSRFPSAIERAGCAAVVIDVTK